MAVAPAPALVVPVAVPVSVPVPTASASEELVVTFSSVMRPSVGTAPDSVFENALAGMFRSRTVLNFGERRGIMIG